MAARRSLSLREGDAALFRAAWPIEDEDMTLMALIREATPDLADLLCETASVLTSEPSWWVEQYGGMAWLCMQAPATRWDDCPKPMRAGLLRVVHAA